MEMLRNWNGDSLGPLQDVLSLFNLEASKLRLVKYEILSPDSFIWVLNANKDRLCIYAEDYVPSLDHVSEMMKQHGALEGETDNYELISLKDPQAYQTSSPVASAGTYKAPANTEEFMKYALPSGYDFVFLGKSTVSSS